MKCSKIIRVFKFLQVNLKNIIFILLFIKEHIDAFCTKCGEFNIANNKCINWIQCETCNRWFHEKCLKLQSQVLVESFKCDLCLYV